MKYTEDTVTGLKLAYIGGGSRGWAWKLMTDLAVDGQLSGTVLLYDIDFNAAKNNEAIGNRLSVRPDVKGRWKYKAVRSLEQALTGADLVIISILPGTFDEMASDVHAPEKYGIYQSVGDTAGPGGLMRALRTIPMYEVFAKAIQKCCPNAWVINYTNPMTLCTRSLYEVFPQIKAFGCCHEVFGTQELFIRMLKDMEGIEGVQREEIRVNVLGINHFTWIDKASYKGEDLLAMYRQFVGRYYESGFEKDQKESWTDTPFACAHRVKFDLFRRYGLAAAAGDRHLAEFLPPWYLKDPETVRSWKFSLTPVSYRKDQLKDLLEKSRRLANGEEELTLEKSGEEGIRQIKALLGFGDFITNVNLPNQGQMAGIPLGSVVETNAVFSRDSVRPLLAGKLPSDVQSLVMRHVLNQETILQAALKRDREMAFHVFINDPLVAIDLSPARRLFDEMLNNTKKYLPDWDI
jgi:alpha-galactosidase